MRKVPSALRLALESLESRLAPAGGITAVVTGGNLTLTGDADNNLVSIIQHADDRLVLVPLMGTQVRLGNSGVFQGVPLTIPTPTTGNLTINLLDGDDGASLVQARLPKAVTINAGNGHNSIAVDSLVIGGNLTISGQEGIDQTYFGGSITVGGNIVISHGNGASTLDGNAAALVVAGDFRASNGTGPATVAWGMIVSVEICGELSINNGPTDPSPNSILISPSSHLELGSLRITHGKGADNTLITASRAVVQGSTIINNGIGNGSTQFQALDELTLGSVSIQSSGGSDLNSIAAPLVTVAGPITFDNGTDANPTTNTIAAGSYLAVSGHVTIRNGAGTNSTQVDVGATGALRLLGNLTIDNRAGISTTNIGPSGGQITIGGLTRITGTTGSKIVSIGAATSPAVSLGSVTIANGDGDNVTSLQGRTLAVNGGVSISGGSGLDLVKLIATTGSATVTRAVDIALGSNLVNPNFQSAHIFAISLGQTFTVGRGLNISSSGSGIGTDLVLAKLVVQGNSLITTEDGNDLLQLNDSTFEAFSLRTHGGDDRLRIETTLGNGTTRFRGRFSVQAGDGDDLVVVGITGSVNTQCIFAAAANTFNGGAGTDELQLFTAGNSIFFAGMPVPTLFEVVS